jgi:hypothetical protein
MGGGLHGARLLEKHYAHTTMNMHLETRLGFVAAAALRCVRSTCSTIGRASIRVLVVVDDLNEPLAAIC